MKDYSVLNGIIESQKIALRTAYDKGYNQAVTDSHDYVIQHNKEVKSYERGLETAWRCAKRIMSMTLSDQEKIFNMQDERVIMDAHSAEEAIDILKRYDEDEKRCKTCIHDIIDSDGDRVCNLTREKYEKCINPSYIYHEPKQSVDDIKVGDEVLNHHGTNAIVIKVDHDSYFVIWANMETKRSCINVWHASDIWKKTGKHFDDIEEIINQLKME